MHTLLKEKQIKIPPHPFATDWQAVIFKNYGTVKTENLAKVLKTDVATIEKEAARLGLDGRSYNPNWKDKGYITIIRNNWHLLGYDGICTLAETSEEQLAKTLLEDDFLFVKVGGFKPAVVTPTYSPLTPEQIAETEKQAKIVRENRSEKGFPYFNFFKYVPQIQEKAEKTDALAMVYNYNELFGDNLFTGDFFAYSDEILQSLSQVGITALWKHVVLYDLVGLPFDERYGEGWETRLKNLKVLCDKLEKYGIKLYLYLNEPRAMPIAFFEGREELLGVHDDEVGALCTSSEPVQKYLYEGVKKLVENVPNLGGFISITMSENLTNCYSRCDQYDIKACPRCSQRTRKEVCVEINELYQKAIKDAGSSAKLLAWTWGWTEAFGWSPAETLAGVSDLSKEISVMCVSEEALKIPTDEGGEFSLVDYSISQVGPSERTAKIFKTAKESGHKVVAKMQINNSWECSAVPYLACFDLIWEHLQNLRALDVDGHMYSWSLGGYPSFNLSLAAHAKTGKPLEAWYQNTFGDDWENVKKASEAFSAAFRQLPFGVSFLYFGPQNIGCANPFYEEPTGLTSTMVGFPYDDIDAWRGGFKKQTFKAKLQAMAEGWKQGLAFLESVKGYNASCVKRIASATYCLLYSTYLQTEWVLTRDKKAAEAEWENTQNMLKLAAQDGTIGYEASNHYLFNENTLLEKLLNLQKILNK